MDFLKNHYEKLVLSVVLLGLAAAAGYLPFEVASVRERLASVTTSIEEGKVDPLPPLDLSTNEAVLGRLKGKVDFNFGEGTHGLFNPSGVWKKGPGPGGWPPIPPAPSGLLGLGVTNINPLILKIEFQGLSQTGGSGTTRYRFYAQNQASTNSALQRGRIVILGTNDKPDVFLIKEVIGARENPDGFVLELSDSRTAVSVAKDRPFSDVAGYSADLRHEREGRSFLRQRQGAKLSVGGSGYNVVAISASDVTIEDEKTKRRTVIPLNR
jgi:hypothetical protein